MSIRLMVEVLDHYHGPPTRKLWLVAFAESASDDTRAGWPPRYKLAHRAGVSASRASHIAAELVAEGVIKRDGSAYHGHAARYVLMPLPSPERVRPESNLKGAAREQPSAGKGCAPGSNLKGAAPRRKVATAVATHPSYPLNTSLNAAPAAPPPTAQTILAEFIDWDRTNGGQLTRRTTGQLAKQIADLLAEGIAEETVKRGLADWRDRDQHPSTLHSFVDAAMNGRPVRPRRENERQAQLARQLERARRLDAAERGELT